MFVRVYVDVSGITGGGVRISAYVCKIWCWRSACVRACVCMSVCLRDDGNSSGSECVCMSV